MASYEHDATLPFLTGPWLNEFAIIVFAASCRASLEFE